VPVLGGGFGLRSASSMSWMEMRGWYGEVVRGARGGRFVANPTSSITINFRHLRVPKVFFPPIYPCNFLEITYQIQAIILVFTDDL